VDDLRPGARVAVDPSQPCGPLCQLRARPPQSLPPSALLRALARPGQPLRVDANAGAQLLRSAGQH
jgi:hypothetical protein